MVEALLEKNLKDDVIVSHVYFLMSHSWCHTQKAMILNNFKKFYRKFFFSKFQKNQEFQKSIEKYLKILENSKSYQAFRKVPQNLKFSRIFLVFFKNF